MTYLASLLCHSPSGVLPLTSFLGSMQATQANE